MADLVAAIDQGTTSTRCILFDRAGTSVSSHQLEHDQHRRQPPARDRVSRRRSHGSVHGSTAATPAAGDSGNPC